MLKVALHIVWLAVVLGGLAIVVFRFEEHGIWGIGAILVGVAMLVIYALSFFTTTDGRAGLANLVSDYALALLILGAIAVLAISLITGFRRFGLGVDLILLLFLGVFVGIFRDYLKHLKSKKNRRKSA
jgi:drug/metabolite transporter (DMT)-like permease